MSYEAPTFAEISRALRASVKAELPREAYVYSIAVDGVIRYVGKGRRYRMWKHLGAAKEVARRRLAGERINPNKVHSKLAHALINGAKIDLAVLSDGMSDEDAYAKERDAIAAFPMDQLWNVLEGGKGPSSRDQQKLWANTEFKTRIVSALRASWSDPERRERQGQALAKRYRDPEYKRRHSESLRKRWTDPDYRERVKAARAIACSSPEFIAKKREQGKRNWENPEWRASQLRKYKEVWSDPERRRKRGEAIKRGLANRRAKLEEGDHVV